MSVDRRKLSLDLFFYFNRSEFTHGREIKVEKRGDDKGEFDWPLLRYGMSLQHRITCLSYSYNQLLRALEDAHQENEKLKTERVCSAKPGIIVIYYFESIIDTIFKILETVSAINILIFENDSGCPKSYEKQLKMIEKGSIIFTERYRNTAIKHKRFVEIIGEIRHNSTHYSMGLQTWGVDTEGKELPQCLLFELRDFEDPTTITNVKKIYNINEKTDEIMELTYNWLTDVFDSYLDLLDKNLKVRLWVEQPEKVEERELIIGDYLNGDVGKVVQEIPKKSFTYLALLQNST